MNNAQFATNATATQPTAKSTENRATAQQIWKKCHWLFFINIQGLIICLRRFEQSIAANNLLEAQAELDTATCLMIASGAVMELAGSFSRQEYEDTIRPSMLPPNVKAPDFSGMMSWEHASLVEIWKRLSPTFKTIPAVLAGQHERFIAAYFSLASAHKSICEKFGGSERGSLRCDRGPAVPILDKIIHSRKRLIDPNRKVATGCPFH